MHMYFNAGPADFIPLTGISTFITVVALPLTVDGLSCVLNDLIALLETKAHAEAPVLENVAGVEIRQSAQEAVAARHRKRCLEKEERRDRARKAHEAEVRRKRWRTTCTKMSRAVLFALIAVGVAFAAWHFRDRVPPLWGVPTMSIQSSTHVGRAKEGAGAQAGSEQYYRLIFDRSRILFHLVLDWIKRQGVKPGHRMEVYHRLRSRAYLRMDLLAAGWVFEAPPRIRSWRLQYNGDPGDSDKLTYLLIQKMDRVLMTYDHVITGEEEKLKALIQARVAEGYHLTDGDDAPDIWIQWSTLMVQELNSVYKFLHDNGFEWPPEAGNHLAGAPDKGGKFEVHFSPS